MLTLQKSTVARPLQLIGVTNVTGKGLTDVTVKGGGAVTIDNVSTAATPVSAEGTTLESVTLDSVDADSAIKGEGLNEVTVKGATASSNTVTITNAKADHALTVNVDGTGYDASGTAQTTIVEDSVAKTITVNATSEKSNLSLTGSTAATTVNVTGSAALTLAPLASATTLDGSAATGNLTLGDLAAGTVTVSTGTGNDTFGVQATAKTTVDTNAGNDAVSLTSAVAAGSTVDLGAGDDKLLDDGGSVVASTTTETTTIDAGEGVDTVSAALINAANAEQFQNFEALDLSAAATLDTNLMTGSTITSLTLTGGAGTNATVTNVDAGVGLTVSGDNSGGTTTIGVEGATAAASTDDSFAITFDGEAAAGATATAKTAVDAGTVALAGIENVSIDSTGEGFVANNTIVTATSLQSLTITGDKDLNLDFGTNTGNATAPTAQNGLGVATIDGSAATGELDIDTTNVTAATAGLTVKGGSADDTITLDQAATVDASAGDDTITASAAGGTFTGGAGDDKFAVSSAAVANADLTTDAAVVTSITDFEAGDTIQFGGATQTFAATKIALDSSVTDLNDAAALAVGSSDTVSWFQYGADTYVVQDNPEAGATTDTFDANDIVVKLTGAVDLSEASITAGGDLAIA